MDRAKLSRDPMCIISIMRSRIVTLTTDFGLKDPYVAEMKAVILNVCPHAVIVDITHEIEKFNIRMGAYMLASAAPYFPASTIHVAVVDPGVGTKRRSIVIQTKQGFFVGPDNGLLVLAAEKQGIVSAHEITNSRFMLPKVSFTFHGRDIFAPAAAHLLNGAKPEELGPEIRDVTHPEFAKVTEKNGAFIGEVLHVDGFGNIITNISEKELSHASEKATLDVDLLGRKLKLPLCQAYGEARLQEPLALIGSHGFLEIAINQGSAAHKFKVKAGDKIAVCPHKGT
ncbi:MAG: S-adenosyl-l-methionine hydroxide adenosyltransferase family protein [Candidatus Bathyarchaeota archaeon]|nr:S-adenosyl-l-methionine hydroxide adenosyltransferase family protein [Candidatus Bathyarchaeota archaeon]